MRSTHTRRSCMVWVFRKSISISIFQVCVPYRVKEPGFLGGKQRKLKQKAFGMFSRMRSEGFSFWVDVFARRCFCFRHRSQVPATVRKSATVRNCLRATGLEAAIPMRGVLHKLQNTMRLQQQCNAKSYLTQRFQCELELPVAKHNKTRTHRSPKTHESHSSNAQFSNDFPHIFEIAARAIYFSAPTNARLNEKNHGLRAFPPPQPLENKHFVRYFLQTSTLPRSETSVSYETSSKIHC